MSNGKTGRKNPGNVYHGAETWPVGKHKKRHITDHTALQIHTVMTILHQYIIKNQNQMTPK